MSPDFCGVAVEKVLGRGEAGGGDRELSRGFSSASYKEKLSNSLQKSEVNSSKQVTLSTWDSCSEAAGRAILGGLCGGAFSIQWKFGRITSYPEIA